jgi:hypothetical protein
VHFVFDSKLFLYLEPPKTKDTDIPVGASGAAGVVVSVRASVNIFFLVSFV